MGSVGLRIVGCDGNEITLFYSQPYYSNERTLKNRLYLGIPPDCKLVAKNGETERRLLRLIEEGLGDLAESKVDWSEEKCSPECRLCCEKKFKMQFDMGAKLPNSRIEQSV